MKRIALYARIFLTAAIICAAALAAALVLRFSLWEYCVVFTLMGTTLMAALFFASLSNLATAKTIVDSAVICIQPAVICGRTDEVKEKELRESFGIYVSCFGILLGTKVIRFNQNGIWLKSVGIGQDYISFGYGERGEELQAIRLLYSRPDEETIAGIVENFRKETGVVPTIIE